jgi:hypothetical protein
MEDNKIEQENLSNKINEGILLKKKFFNKNLNINDKLIFNEINPEVRLKNIFPSLNQEVRKNLILLLLDYRLCFKEFRK